MNLHVLTLLLSTVVLSLIASSVWIIRLLWGDPLLVQFVGVMGVNSLLGGVLWIGYTVYAMYWLIPKADAVIDPELSEQLQLRGDFMFYRLHRLLFYASSSASRWCNGRLHSDFDFRRLPRNLRIPLAVHFHWLWLTAFAMASGCAALKLGEIQGLIVID